jgi:hypothetical protein
MISLWITYYLAPSTIEGVTVLSITTIVLIQPISEIGLMIGIGAIVFLTLLPIGLDIVLTLIIV